MNGPLSLMKQPWEATAVVRSIAHDIAMRASALADSANIDSSPARIRSYILWVHLNITPLRLVDLQRAEDGDFAHDVWGILKNFDIDIMSLRNGFLPRFAVDQ